MFLADSRSLGTVDLKLPKNGAGLAWELGSLVMSARAEPSRLRIRQEQLLRRMIQHCHHNVPLYREIWTQPGELTELPIIDKSVLRAFTLGQRMSGDPPEGTRTMRSSGTTGEPILVMYPPGFARWQGLLAARGALKKGIFPWQRRAGLTFLPDLRPKSPTITLLSRRFLSLPWNLPIEELATRVAAYKPRVITGHPHLLLEVGRLLSGSLRPRAATWGESIDPATRAALEECYGTLLDTYGTVELGVVASQCGEGDVYHVNHESVLVELLDDGSRPVKLGEAGDVVLTGLANPLMPFVRYRIGDRSRWSPRPCKCGYSQPGLSGIDGRSLDWVTAGDGTKVAPEHLWLMARSDRAEIEPFTPLVKRYQIRQIASGKLLVMLELKEQAPQEFLDKLASSYRTYLEVPVEVQVVERLTDDPARKFRLISSEIP